MNEDCCCKKIFLAKPKGNKPRGQTPLRWIDCVENDLKVLKIKNWETIVKSRDAWRRPEPTQDCRAIEEVPSLLQQKEFVATELYKRRVTALKRCDEVRYFESRENELLGAYPPRNAQPPFNTSDLLSPDLPMVAHTQ
ncbi:hypothetical protein TNCV_1809551 [Trichonephila clavipes]|nr:hypothetical protein TNCV_1809551 [Trichonephila clavipes]